MTIEEAIVGRLKGLSVVTALVGTRIHLDRLPQSPDYPSVRVQEIDDEGSLYLRGPVGIKRARIQVDAFDRERSGHDPYAGASAVAEAIYGNGAGDQATGLFGFVGFAGGSPAMRILVVEDGGRRRDYDPKELRVLTVSQDYLVHYRP
jgi:hypothetical protein